MHLLSGKEALSKKFAKINSKMFFTSLFVHTEKSAKKFPLIVIVYLVRPTLLTSQQTNNSWKVSVKEVHHPQSGERNLQIT